MEQANPARLYALVFGAVLVAAGILGFFYNTSFEAGGDIERDAVLGVLDVNAWHNIVHLATGALGLAAAGSVAASRSYALGLGVVYVAVAVWGFIVGDAGAILDLVPVNTEDNVLHLAIGVVGLGAGAAAGGRGAAPAAGRP